MSHVLLILYFYHIDEGRIEILHIGFTVVVSVRDLARIFTHFEDIGLREHRQNYGAKIN
jgi:hypothetical protein